VVSLAVYGALVGMAALAWQAWSWQASQRRSTAVNARAREAQAIANLQAALDDVVVATGRAHGARFKPIKAHSEVAALLVAEVGDRCPCLGDSSQQ
jgi:hypothetical protein